MTPAELHEGRLGSLPWITVRGTSGAVFRALGYRARHEIADTLDRYPERAHLQAYTASAAGSRVVAAIVDATRSQCPAEWEELVNLARGAGVPFGDLVLLNLRGDLGPTSTGCTDLAWRGERALLAHNEDGLPMFDGRCSLVTLAIDDAPPVTTFWYPGMLPSNAFVVCGSHLVWSLDHLGAAEPALAAGRHFVARKAQRATTLADAVAVLEAVPSAGGFAYNIGEPATTSIVCIEAAAGRVSPIAAAGDGLMWHANTMRYLDGIPETPDEESRARSRRLAAVADGTAGAGGPALLDLLTRRDAPPGLFRSAVSPDPLMTLCSAVFDLGERTMTIVPRGDDPVTLPLEEFSRTA